MHRITNEKVSGEYRSALMRHSAATDIGEVRWARGDGNNRLMSYFNLWWTLSLDLVSPVLMSEKKLLLHACANQMF